MPSDDEMTINVEDILPETLRAIGRTLHLNSPGLIYTRLGNMVILQASKNSLIGNSSFANRKPVLKASAYLLTSDVAKNPTWGIAEINERQNDLAALAVKTWPLTG